MRDTRAEAAVWQQPVKEEEQLLSVVPQESEMAKKRRVLIVGAGEVGHLLARNLQEAGYEVVGFVDDQIECSITGLRVLGSRADIERIVDEYDVDEVMIAYSPTWQQRLAEMLVSNGHRHVKIKVVPGIVEVVLSGPVADRVGDVPVVDITPRLPSKQLLVAKRLFDIVFSIVGLLISFPFLLVAAIAIKMSSPGPILYKQERVGKDGKSFYIYKLRTMVRDAEKITGPVLASKGDPRITTIGRILRATKLDEVPQFINVLWGHMSVVGPRPERPNFVEEYRERIPHYDERHRIKPGITGWAQVMGGYHTTVYDKLRYDLMYLYHMSLWLDLKIILLTIWTVLKRREGC
ncbi:MAG: sugar transferase [Armatimonadota bacterium]|nr:sugar transferase [bacterium]MDW8320381.1 sugar transferase [Armatimonadota bacterium]